MARAAKMFSSGQRKSAGAAGTEGCGPRPEKILAVRSERSESPVALPAAPARLNKPGYTADPATGNKTQDGRHGRDRRR